ncbi:MAG: radical SAM protein [Syntrophothermus sp.]|uniref:radical SAM protein n=1 Tax=Syntrophothermus sp. TaxID=2736299 RepID=UPI0025800B96|nr:radical SAM protein [Syntrophothermus sp.]NSW82088.1 radical SAM protein [Syntrophothermus sp.]
MYLTLFADEKGRVFEHPQLQMLGRTADSWALPKRGEMMRLPSGASLVMVPQHYPVGWDPEQGKPVLLEANPYSGRGRVYAVAALLPQGFTRTYLPATVVPTGKKTLPLLGYAAVALKGDEVYVAAIQTDEHRKWHPRFYNTPSLEKRIEKRLSLHSHNRILQHLSHCAKHYSCFTAQNIFYERWEGGIPTSPACNAACIGCISEQHGDAVSPQDRLDFVPEVEEIVEVGVHHLERAREGIISFGQGCEGEPSLNHEILAEAVKAMRKRTGRGTINLNTNAGFTEGIKKIVDAGLDAMRVTIFSSRPENYAVYHRPRDFQLEDVEESIRYARKKGVYVSLNLLTFPGFTDREDEIRALLDFVTRNGVSMVQLRNLNLDPEQLFPLFSCSGATVGVKGLILALRSAKVRVGSYTYPKPK